MTSADETMRVRNEMGQPFAFWLLEEMFAGQALEPEETNPISDREFYTWLGVISSALAVYGVLFRFLTP